MSNTPVSLGSLSKQTTHTYALTTPITLSQSATAWLVMDENLRFPLYKMPNFLHRLSIRIYFGWKIEKNVETQTIGKQLLNG